MTEERKNFGLEPGKNFKFGARMTGSYCISLENPGNSPNLGKA